MDDENYSSEEGVKDTIREDVGNGVGVLVLVAALALAPDVYRILFLF